MPERRFRKPTTPWYEATPPRPARRIRRRDKVEFTIALLLLTSLLGLLVVGVARDDHGTARPGVSLSP